MIRWFGAALIALLTAMAFVGPATAKPVTLTFKERGGDFPKPELDIHSAVLRYDRAAGSLAGAVSLGAPPNNAVINSIEFYLGRYRVGDGSCTTEYNVAVAIPDAEDIGAGLTNPYTEIFRGRHAAKSIGFLATNTSGSTIIFDTSEASPQVINAVKRGRFTCAEIETSTANTFNTGDHSKVAPFVNGPVPKCRVLKRRGSAGQEFPVRCKHAGKRVSVWLSHGKDLFHGHEQVRGGRFRVPTTSTMHGTWHVTIFNKHQIAIGAFALKVR